MTLAFYNDNDGFCCQWLAKLMAQGCIMPGTVDDRSIVDVPPVALAGFTRCHFFAGIAGWELALKLAGWPADRPVWTGSCPCQPISSAGPQRGDADARHVWPAFHALIAECRPAIVFGEQVASGDGREWLAAVRADLECLGYAVGAADLPAAGVGAPHRRQRLWWVASAMGDAIGARQPEREGEAGDAGGAGRAPPGKAPQPAGPWSDVEWLACADGKARPAQPGLHPLAHGIPERVGRLRGYGNAIVPQVAATFVRAAAEVLDEAGL